MEIRKTLSVAVYSLARCLARFCLKNAFTYQECDELLRLAFIHEAKKMTKKPNIMRVSAATGLRRKEVKRLWAAEPDEVVQHTNVFGQVVLHWLEDAEFINKNGTPKNLTFGNKDSEFSKLVERIKTELTPASILEHLIANKVAKHHEDGTIALLQEAFIPSQDLATGFNFVRMDVDDLVEAVFHNCHAEPSQRNLHATTEFTHIERQHLPEIRKWILNKGAEFHRSVRGYIGQYDCDSSRSTATEHKDTTRIIVSCFSFIDDTSRKE